MHYLQLYIKNGKLFSHKHTHTCAQFWFLPLHAYKTTERISYATFSLAVSRIRTNDLVHANGVRLPVTFTQTRAHVPGCMHFYNVYKTRWRRMPRHKKLIPPKKTINYINTYTKICLWNALHTYTSTFMYIFAFASRSFKLQIDQQTAKWGKAPTNSGDYCAQKN